jgi:putative transposase
LAGDVGVQAACRALEVPAASYYRWCRPPEEDPRPRTRPPLALSAVEEQAVLDVLHAGRFVDVAPPEVYATLLEEETYFCSTRTMYRILERHGEVRERRDQLRHPQAAKPELLATAPNQVWSWDITKLKGPAKWTYFYLYVILDIFSRYVVGWLLAHRESAELAKRLIRETLTKEGIEEGTALTIHSDRGPSMTSKTVGQLLADLSITRSLSRPYTSNDNPFSEAQFHTLKYRPEFPERFGSHEHGLSFLRSFFPWYNEAHRHGGIAFFTPGQVHRGEAALVLEKRERALAAAFLSHPSRFKGRRPRSQPPPAEVWINPPALDRNGDPSPRSRQNLLIDHRHGTTGVLRASLSNATEGGKDTAAPKIGVITTVNTYCDRPVVQPWNSNFGGHLSHSH